MMKYIVILLLLLFQQAWGHAPTAGKEYIETKVGVVDDGYNFWIRTPADYQEATSKQPLIIFLHGASLCGRDLNRVRRYGVLNAIDRGQSIPALVVAPQNPGGAWVPRRINNVLEWVCKHYRVDENKVYVLGMSLGGYGTLDFVGSYPEKIAAAMALCGGCSLKNQEGLGKVPLWIMHGTADRAVHLKESKAVVDRLKASKLDKLLRYEWIKGGNHGIPVRLFYMPQTYDWLFLHSLTDQPRVVDKTIKITSDDIQKYRRKTL